MLRTPQNPACPHHHAPSSIQFLLENASWRQAQTGTVTTGTVTELGHALALKQLLVFNHGHPFPSHQHIPFCPFGQSQSLCAASVPPALREQHLLCREEKPIHPTAGLESCYCPGSFSGSKCHIPSAGISSREAQDFLLSLIPGCEIPAPAPQATGAGRGVHKETTQGRCLASGCGRALHSRHFLEGSDQHHRLTPTATPWGIPLLHPKRQKIPAASPQTGRNPSLSPWLALGNAIRLGPPAQ